MIRPAVSVKRRQIFVAIQPAKGGCGLVVTTNDLIRWLGRSNLYGRPETTANYPNAAIQPDSGVDNQYRRSYWGTVRHWHNWALFTTTDCPLPMGIYTMAHRVEGAVSRWWFTKYGRITDGENDPARTWRGHRTCNRTGIISKVLLPPARWQFYS